jgi:lysophospholipase L1-like esterase
MSIPSACRTFNAMLEAVLVLSLAGRTWAAEPAILIHDGQKIGFMGDSITQQGDAPDGYIGLVIFGLQVEGIAATPIPAGVPGHTSGNMRARVGPQILSQDADWMTLSCGVNDIIMQKKGKGVDLAEYRKNVAFMVEAALAKGVKVVLMTPTPLGEDLDNEDNRQLATYIDFLHAYAKEKQLPVAEVNAMFRDYLKTADPAATPGRRLLADGIHPNKTGQALMAQAVLAALGVPAADFAKLDRAQMDNPVGKGVKLSDRTVVLISPNQYAALLKIANDRPGAVPALVEGLWNQALEDLGAAADPTPELKAAAQAKLGPLVDALIRTSAGKR